MQVHIDEIFSKDADINVKYMVLAALDACSHMAKTEKSIDFLPFNSKYGSLVVKNLSEFEIIRNPPKAF